MTITVDLFGLEPAQASLFGSGDDRMHAPQQSSSPSPEYVRSRLTMILQKAKTAKDLPWSERETKMWQTVFPNMAKWLPAEEAQQLRLEFNKELQRLTQKAA